MTFERSSVATRAITEEYEGDIASDKQAMIASGLDPQPETIEGFHFSERAVVKLWRKGLSKSDAMFVLSQNHIRKSERTAANSEACGNCTIGFAKIVFKPNDESSIDAAFLVVTGHRIEKMPLEFRS